MLDCSLGVVLCTLGTDVVYFKAYLYSPGDSHPTLRNLSSVPGAVYWHIM